MVLLEVNCGDRTGTSCAGAAVMIWMAPMTRVLILYIVHNSGHHAAARALAAAVTRQDPSAEVACLDLLHYTHPGWARIIERMYMTTIRRTPELWEAMYDSFWVEHLTRSLRRMVQRGRSEALTRLMAEFDPQAVMCTQAYPFSVMASFAARQRLELPLFGVTTDFVPHRFWVVEGHRNTSYVVPTDSAAARLMWLGVRRERIHVLGIPVAVERMGVPSAMRPDDRHVLVMGGSRGIGIRYRTVRRLDRCPEAFTIDVICGSNRRLRRLLDRHGRDFKHTLCVRGYVDNALPLMARAELLLTKAGGMTLAEAVCMGVPLLLVRPLPGQEQGNTEVMVHHGAALDVRNESDVARSVSTLLNSRSLLAMMRAKAAILARPYAADRIVATVLDAVPPGGPA